MIGFNYFLGFNSKDYYWEEDYDLFYGRMLN